MNQLFERNIENRDSPFSINALRQIAKEKVIRKLTALFHSVIFILANIFLLLLNLFTSPGILWELYVLSSWFVGLGIHITLYLIYSRGITGKSKRLLIFHAIVSFLVMQLLFVINYVSDFSNCWILWPNSAITCALLIHFIIYSIFNTKRKSNGIIKFWIEKKIELELKKRLKIGKNTNFFFF